jgi:two-component system, OmpR family, response regulator
MPLIFLLEDDPIVKEAIKMNLEAEGFDILAHSTLATAKEILENSMDFDLFVLDVNLPDGNGFEFCTWIRERGSLAPVIFLTARSDEDSLVQGFDSGGDDFLRKPFQNRELTARIRYQLSQSQGQEKILRFNDVILSVSKQELKCDEFVLSLNRREFQILKAFFESPGVILSRDSLLDKISPSAEILDRTIDTHISHLRSKLKKNNFHRFSISSVYGSGYKIEINDAE